MNYTMVDKDEFIGLLITVENWQVAISPHEYSLMWLVDGQLASAKLSLVDKPFIDVEHVLSIISEVQKARVLAEAYKKKN